MKTDLFKRYCPPKPEHASTLTLSVVIPARNEFPNICHTIYSILHCWEADGYDSKEIEIIIVDNCSDDSNPLKPGDKGTVTYLMGRGGFWSRAIRVLYDPIAGNHSARNKGARIARGKYLFFSDAHMAYKPGFFKNVLKTVDESGGLVHGVIGWMGAYPPYPGGLGCQYTLKLGEEIKGTWANYFLDTEKWFYIPALGHCSVAVRRDQFINFGGYPDIHRCYGGGEFYLNMKWWMFGSSVAVHPQGIGYHLASSRGYTYNHDDYKHNVLNIGWALGADEWTERAYINWLRKGRKEVMERLWNEAKEETADDRAFIAKSRKMTFNDLLINQPWNKRNQKRLGKSNGHITIFHDTWLDLLKTAPDYVKEMYNKSELQKSLDKLINEKLSKYVYKRKKIINKERVLTSNAK